MSALSIYTNDLESQYKEFYATPDSQTLYKLSPISAIYYVPKKPVKNKYLNACEQTINDLFAKYDLTEDDRWDYQRRYESWYDTFMKYNGNMNMLTDEWRGNGESYRAFNLNKAYEKVMNWNMTKVLLYIIEARARYKTRGGGSRYSTKYDSHLYEFCYLFASYYYGKEDLETKALNLIQHLYDKASKFYNKLTNYINSIPELKFLRGIQNETSSLSSEQFKRCYTWRFGQ